MSIHDPRSPHKGRGATLNVRGRFESREHTREDDGWGSLDEPLPPLETIVKPEAARSIVSRNSSPDIPFSQSINPYRGCEHGCVYCLEGETPILYADGSHRPIKAAKVGDVVIGTVRHGRYRRYVETRIANHWTSVKPAYRIRLADGTELIASGDHRFLTERGWKFVTGEDCGSARRPHLTLQDRLLGTGAFAGQPEMCADYRLGYLCGLIKGDLIDTQAIQRARRYLETFQVRTNEFEFQKGAGESRALQAIRTNRRVDVEAIRALVRWPEACSDSWCKGFLAGVTDPAIPRKRAIAGIHLEAQTDLRVAAIEPLGRAVRMYDITTGTGDFIANGVVSHNCYARPSHAYVDLSPGLDFETRLFYKRDAAALLKKELAAKRYVCSPIALGANTDPYQPIERTYRVTRQILEVLSACNHPATIVTKGAALIGRDIDLLASMARRNLVAVYVSITTLDKALKRTLEPRAASPSARLAVIEKLAAARVPVGVMVAPVIPVLTDHEAERILVAAAEAGAKEASYVMLRLPHEVAQLFRAWLEAHEPLKAAHVMSRLNELRGGRDNDPRFGSRLKGEGVYAELFKQRFVLACRKYGLNQRRGPALDTSRFTPPAAGPQIGLFDP